MFIHVVVVQSPSRVRVFATPKTATCQASLSFRIINIWCIYLFTYAVLCLVAQSRPTLCDPMDCSLPGSSVHGDSPGKNTGVGCHAFLQGIFPTQGSNLCLLSSTLAVGFSTHSTTWEAHWGCWEEYNKLLPHTPYGLVHRHFTEPQNNRFL